MIAEEYTDKGVFYEENVICSYGNFMVLSLAIPCSATTTSETSNMEGTEIHVDEYMDFYNNQQYYKNLVAQGYTVIVNVGEEYAEMEEARIEAESNEMDELIESKGRGTSVPTARWNINTEGKYSFSGSAAYSTLYLGYLIYGHDGYGTTVYNKSETNTLTVNAHGCISERSFTVDPLTSRLEKFTMFSASNNFYLSFNAPSYFSGTIGTYTYQ